MIQIAIPEHFLAEREYVIDVLFREFLGLEYKITVREGSEYNIDLGQGRMITIHDGFFAQLPSNTEYLRDDYISKKVTLARNPFTIEKDIPVIFGNEHVLFSSSKITCGIDIFASTFFMLSRWEELVNRTKDEHDRFPAHASLAVRHNFLHRPIVNEYVEMLWNMLCYLGMKCERKKREFRLVPTHDIDNLYYPFSIKLLLADLIKKNKISNAYKRIQYISRMRNPYDCFSFFIDLAIKNNIQSRFYLMTGGSYKHDAHYSTASRSLQILVKKLKKTGQIIGFHPSYYTYNNETLWAQEKQKLEKSFEIKLTEGRQHFLRFEVPITWRIWEKNTMNVDSSLAYPEMEGFRCGTGDEFPVFDVLHRIRLNLRERPLIVMDVTLNLKKKLSLIESRETLNCYVSLAKKFAMPCTLLFHNNLFDEIDWLGWKELYAELLNKH